MHPFLQPPKDWAVARLADLVVKVGSGATPRGGKSAYLHSRERYALVRSQNVLDRRLDTDGVTYISNNDAARLTNAEIQENDVLLNITGDGVTFARSCLADPAVFPCVVNQHVSIIRTVPELLAPGFLLGYLSLGDTKRYIESFNAGGSRRAITKGNIESFLIPLPPIDEQRRIAAVLSALDDKIELNRKMNRTLEEMAQALFKSWFIDFDGHEDFEPSELGPIPTGWRVGRLHEIEREGKYATTAGPFGSKLTREHYVAAGVPVIRGVNLGGTDGWFSDKDYVYITEQYAEELSANMAYPGDVIFTQRGTLGQVGLIPSDSQFPRYILSQSQMKLSCAPWMPASYVYLNFARPATVQYIHANAVSSGVPHINLTFLRNFPVLIPDRAALARFGAVVDPLHRKMTLNSRENDALTQLRDLLLPKLISGELRVPETLTLPIP